MSMRPRQPRVAVLGGGSWGTTVASIVSRSAPTVLWSRSPDTAAEVNDKRRNRRYLGDVELHAALSATAATIAMPDHSSAERLAELFRTSRFRIYSTTDVIGVEVAGALKNVYAIAAGMGDGVGAGYNTKAMVITRSLREMTRLGEAMGG